MKKIKLTLQFRGTDFFGWQIQTKDQATVQGTLEDCLATIYKERVRTAGSGRTDAKVHSLDHHVIFSPPFEIPREALVKGLNAHLPPGIRVISAENVSDDFHVTKDAKSREYRYLFSNYSDQNSFQNDLMTNVSYDLDIEQMRKALSTFVGTFDFQDFHTKGSDPKTTIRTIFEAELHFIETNTHGIFPDHYCIRVVGSGFLKQMMRLIVSCVWKVGRGKLTIEEIAASLQNPTGKHLAPVAPPEGLYKFKVTY